MNETCGDGAGAVGAIIQARLASTRLPGKVLAEIEGRTMLAWVIARLRRSRFVKRIVVAVPEKAESEPLLVEARRAGALVWSGPEHDVLTRTLGAAEAHGIDPVVRITSDCPLIDPELVDAVVAAFLCRRAEGIDLVANTQPRAWPRGLDTEVVSRSALQRASRFEEDPAVREHVTLPIYHRQELFHVAGLSADEDRSHHRWTVDTPEDLHFVRTVYQEMAGRCETFTSADVFELLTRRPEIAALNARIQQKELPQ